MKAWPAVLITLLILGATAAAQSPAAGDRLRSDVEQRFDVLPVTGDIALRPKTARSDVRLIEITDGIIHVNGQPVSGSELQKRLGQDTSLVLRLSYLSPAERQALFAQPPAPGDQPLEGPATPAPPVEGVGAAPPIPPPAAPEPETGARRRRAHGDRVRIFGSVHVGADEAITGQVVAVFGSARIEGEVGDQVVAVMGSVDLGPTAVVRGDVVSVGGRVRRAEGAQIRGSVTEVALAGPAEAMAGRRWGPWTAGPWFDHFSAVPKLVGTTFRFLLLVLLASIALVLARPMVEASAERVTDSPVQSTLVGIMAQILLIPALVLTVVVLAISIIGIPLLLLVPFALVVLILLALAGFSGTVYAVGGAVRRRFSLAGSPPFMDVVLGVLVILLPVLLARLVALAGWPVAPLVFVLLLTGFTIEFLAWSSGFGAVLTNGFTRWQARRASRMIVPPPAVP